MSDEDTFDVLPETTEFSVGQEGNGSMIGSVSKDPVATRTYTIDWRKWPFPPGLTIASTVWAIDADDKTLIIASQSRVGTRSSVKVKGGVLERSYSLACMMTTNDSSGSPEQDVRRIGIQIRLR